MALARRRFSLSMFMGLASGLACAVTAIAQVKSVDPYTVVVSNDKAELRCADLTQAYRVAQLASGASLLVDGEGQTGLRVAYPAGASAFVRAEDADFDSVAGTAKLNKGSKLRAAQFNGNYEFAKSWKGLLESELPPGTELKVLETVKGADGNALAYRVEAPATARAFISFAAVRKQDGTAVTKTGSSKTEPTKSDAKPEVKAQPVPAPAGEPTTASDPAKPAPTPVTVDPAAPTTTVVPAGVKPAPVKRLDKLDGLEAAFRTVRMQSVETAELEPLIAEYKAAMAELPADSKRRPQLAQRIEYLKFQLDLQAQKNRLAELQKSVDDRTRSLIASIADVERTRVYTIIGMLLPSTVYDGKQLPMMYRIQSVGGVAPRTLGYLKPDDKLDIRSKIGLIVGVVGESSIDPTLQLNVVTPVRVDALKASMGPTGTTTIEVDTTPKAPAVSEPKAEPQTSPGFEPIKKLDPEK